MALMRLLMSAYVQIFLSKLPELEFSPRGSINTTRLREITATALQPCRGQARDDDAQMPEQMNYGIMVLKNCRGPLYLTSSDLMAILKVASQTVVVSCTIGI